MNNWKNIKKCLNEYGINSNIVNESIVSFLNNMDWKFENCTSSSDQVAVLICDKGIVKLFSKNQYNSKKHIYNIIINAQKKYKLTNIVTIYSLFTQNNLYGIITERVKPVLEFDNFGMNPTFSLTIHLQTLLEHVKSGLIELHALGICHSDINFDNIGYNYQKKKYVIFDFDKSKEYNNNCNDNKRYNQLYSNFKHYM